MPCQPIIAAVTCLGRVGYCVLKLYRESLERQVPEKLGRTVARFAGRSHLRLASRLVRIQTKGHAGPKTAFTEAQHFSAD